MFRHVDGKGLSPPPLGYTITLSEGVWEGAAVFRAKIRELPDVEEYADTLEGAYLQAVDTIQTTESLFISLGRPMPSPFCDITPQTVSG